MRSGVEWGALMLELAADARAEGRHGLAMRLQAVVTPDGVYEEMDWPAELTRLAVIAGVEGESFISGRLSGLAQAARRRVS